MGLSMHPAQPPMKDATNTGSARLSISLTLILPKHLFAHPALPSMISRYATEARPTPLPVL